MSSGATRMSDVRRASWWALAVVLVAALVVGARSPGAAPGPAQRIATIEADVRCPSCEDISVAQSSAPVAVAIRQAVTERVHAGQGDQAIEDWLVGRYGPGILLRPRASGGVGLVWLVPLLAIAVALGSLGVFFWRRRRLVVVAVSEDDRRLVAHALSDRLGS
ncbi:MAG TPA: cytochrome c-type biogenesis protein [Acidimicrobiales bacterium]|nr:cytochrome c-type biogenesis protein [Acidimicrobiales bacterium]